MVDTAVERLEAHAAELEDVTPRTALAFAADIREVLRAYYRCWAALQTIADCKVERQHAANTVLLRGAVKLAKQGLPMTYPLFWLSFADAIGFRGGVVVRPTKAGILEAMAKKAMKTGSPFRTAEAMWFAGAVETARILGINPGGAAQGHMVPEIVPEEFQNRLLTQEECDDLDKALARALEGDPTGGAPSVH